MRASLVRRLASELPGIGHDKSIRVEAAFASPLDMMLASESDWAKIDGIGKPMAKRIVEAIHNGRE
jgi:ERCC4-type nuclease